MSDLTALRDAKTLPQLARLLKLKGEYVSHSLYWYQQQNPYIHFTIPKKGGGKRSIEAPNSRLKLLQRRLAELLMRIEAGMEGQRTTKARVLAHGFKPNFSIMTNAALHRNKRWVFNMDLKDFFHTINFGRVYGFLLKDRNFSLAPKTAAVIAQIACYQKSSTPGQSVFPGDFKPHCPHLGHQTEQAGQ